MKKKRAVRTSFKQRLILIGSFGVLACGWDQERLQTPSERAGEEAGVRVEVVATGLEVPWSIAFAPGGRMFVTERPGRVRLLENGKLRDEPMAVIGEVEHVGEGGLMGLALDPDFSANHLLYLSYTFRRRGGELANRVVRYREESGRLQDPKIILDDIPGDQFHDGCRLRFGPDGKLYVTTGDATDRKLAQDMKSLAGKILRLNGDGSLPSDNPFPRSPIFSLGHRNPQGIDWHPGGLLFSTEHGPSGFDGGSGGDEVNIVEKGKNYGWPVIHHRQERDGMVSPLLEFTPSVAPASGIFYRGDRLKQFQDNFFFGTLRGQHLHRVVLDEKDPRRVRGHERWFENEYGRIREVAVSPDGALYLTTSNRDGRASPAPDDDRILRIVPR